MDRPVVMTSGNLSDEPQVIDDRDARERLAAIADYALVHDRPIANRVDDSVVRVMAGAPRVLRRARGYAPAPIALPDGFADAPELLAMGGELKATFCLVKDGEAILSQHQGDLDDAATCDDYRARSRRSMRGCSTMRRRRSPPTCIPNTARRSSPATGRERRPAADRGAAPSCPCRRLPGGERPAARRAAGARHRARRLGCGDDGTIWGGEFLLADYRGSGGSPRSSPSRCPAARRPCASRGATSTPICMAEMGWARARDEFRRARRIADLRRRPRATLDAMIAQRASTRRMASSCGRLFDAVAAALGICRERQAYEGEAAARLEALVGERRLRDEDDALAYPFAIPNLRGSGLPYIEPLAMWRALLAIWS